MAARKKSSAKAATAATYVYCVVKGKETPARVKKGGLAETEKPRWVDAGGDFFLLVGTAPLVLYGAEAIDAKLRDIDWVGARAAEHEAVIEQVLELEDIVVVPMKLFTLFTDDERAIAHVKKIGRSLDRIVQRIKGCEEWGLRILFDEARAARLAAEEARQKRRVTSGKDFLLRKKALDDDRKATGAKGKAQVEALYEMLSKTAKSAHRRPAPNRELAGHVLLDAVFLVPSKSVKKLMTTVESSAEKLVEQGFDVSLSGPWPAYSFIGGT